MSSLSGSDRSGSDRRTSSQPNHIINHKYEIQRFLDKGSFGSVYYGINRFNQQPVAIKIETTPVGLLLHETTVLNYLFRNGCLRIPKVFWYGLYENHPCLVMNHYTRSLQDYMPESPQQIVRRILELIRPIHQVGVIHRDIKPSNFMWTSANPPELHLIDFGLSSVYMDNEGNMLGEEPAHAENLTGNVAYMSDFVEQGRKPSRRDDMISIGFVYMKLCQQLIPVHKSWTSLCENEFIKGDVFLYPYLEHCCSLKWGETPFYDFFH